MLYGEISNRADFTKALDKTEDPSSPLLVICCQTDRCPQCRTIAPRVGQLMQEYGASKGVSWYKMNIEVAEDVAMEYGVTATPTFMIFKDGDLMPEEKIMGAHPNKVKDVIEQNLKS